MAARERTKVMASFHMAPCNEDVRRVDGRVEVLNEPTDAHLVRLLEEQVPAILFAQCANYARLSHCRVSSPVA